MMMANLQNAPPNDPVGWYMSIPVVSRTYLTAAVLVAAATSLDLIRPLSLYYSSTLVLSKGQLWRLITTFLYFGEFGLDFIFHMYFLVRYSRMLEEDGDFRGRTSHFLWMILFGATLMLLIEPFFRVKFLGSALTFMMVYIWGRRNAAVQMSFLGLFPFAAPYLPWVLLIFSMLLGNPLQTDIIGIIVGHTYYFLQYVYPVVAEIRGWSVKKLLDTPFLLSYLCGETTQTVPILQAPLVPQPEPRHNDDHED